eukprot:scaffold36614_cov22-Tisochrysis_lutea.AAC.1
MSMDFSTAIVEISLVDLPKDYVHSQRYYVAGCLVKRLKAAVTKYQQHQSSPRHTAANTEPLHIYPRMAASGVLGAHMCSRETRHPHVWVLTYV